MAEVRLDVVTDEKGSAAAFSTVEKNGTSAIDKIKVAGASMFAGVESSAYKTAQSFPAIEGAASTAFSGVSASANDTAEAIASIEDAGATAFSGVEGGAAQAASAITGAGLAAKKTAADHITSAGEVKQLGMAYKQLGSSVLSAGMLLPGTAGEFATVGTVALHMASSVKSAGAAMKSFGAMSVVSLGTFGMAGAAAGAAAVGWVLGKVIDEWTYKLTGIDLSGMNALKKITQETKDEMEAMASRIEKNRTTIAKLGLGSRQEFNAAVASGGVKFDNETLQWMRAAEYEKVQWERITKESEEALKKENERIREQEEAARKLADALGEWKNQTDMMAPSLSGHDKEVMQISDSYVKLQQSLTDMKAPMAAFAEAEANFWRQMTAVEAKKAIEEATEAFKKAQEETLAGAEKEKTEYQDLISYAREYRESLVKTYEDASAKAQAYYAEAKRIGDMMIGDKAWLDSLHPQNAGSFENQMQKDKEALNSLISSAFRSENVDQVQGAFDKIRAFFDKYKGQRDILGFSSDFSNYEDEANQLYDKLGRLKDQTEAQSDAWQTAAVRQINAIQAVDDWVYYLQLHVIELDDIVNATKVIKIDTSTATSAILDLTDRVLYLQSLYSSIGKVGPSNADLGEPYIPPPKGAVGTNYVKKTGLAIIHEGETITPSKYVGRDNPGSRGNGAGTTINLGGIVIYGSDKSPAQLAREIAKPLKRELRRLSEISG